MEAGIDDVRLQDLRHTRARHPVLNGVPVPVVSRLLGHEDVGMTLRHAHLRIRDIDKAAERVGQAVADLMRLLQLDICRHRALRAPSPPDLDIDADSVLGFGVVGAIAPRHLQAQLKRRAAAGPARKPPDKTAVAPDEAGQPGTFNPRSVGLCCRRRSG